MSQHSIKISTKNFCRIWNLQMKITAETEKKPTIDETIGIIIEKAYPDKKHDIYVLDKLHETK